MPRLTETVIQHMYFFKRLSTVSLVILVLGCNTGGSGGESANSNRTDIAETTANTLLVDQPALNWIACEDQRALECATLLVPLDYANPDGETVTVAMARRVADQPDESRTLITNPGGPGAGGIESLNSLLRFGAISESMTDKFNFVSFDPRGIGASQPVQCDETDLFSQNLYPADRAAIEFNFTKSINFSQSCVSSSGDYVQHLGSFNVVRDINEMRKALGLAQIDFLGYSYGTRLAALYMQTYPQNTGRFVLDGSMKPEPELVALAFGALQPGQANMNRLAEQCIGIPVLCNPDEFVSDLQARIDEFVALPATEESLLFFRILQFTPTRPELEHLLIGSFSRYLQTQNAQELELLRIALGVTVNAEDDEVINRTAFTAVMCADDPARPTVDSLDALRQVFNAESDLLAESQLPVAGMCAGWPESIDPIPQIATNQAPVSLVIGGPSDAQTPLVFAQEMAAAVGGQFLRSEHDGHVTVFTTKNQCTNEAAETFLLTGNLPITSVCEAGEVVDAAAMDWQDSMSHLPY